MKHVVYRLVNGAGVPVYIGATNDLGRRINEHENAASWWSDVSRIDFTCHSTREEARVAEEKAIREEQPIHNVNWGPKLSREFARMSVIMTDRPRPETEPFETQRQFIQFFLDATEGVSSLAVKRHCKLHPATTARWLREAVRLGAIERIRHGRYMVTDRNVLCDMMAVTNETFDHQQAI